MIRNIKINMLKRFFILLLGTLILETQAEPVGPGDWSSLRLYGHAYNVNGFTDTEYEFIADHNYLFAIEKRHAYLVYGSPSSEFASGIAAEDIKANNPLAKPLFYWNSNIVYNSIYKTIQDGIVEDPSLVASNGKFNYENANFPDWWVSVAQDNVNNAAHEGVFIDACQNVESTWGSAGMDTLYDMLDQIPGLVIVNGYWPSGNKLLAGPEILNHADGIFVESFFHFALNTLAEGKMVLDALLEVPADKYIIASGVPDGIWANDHEFFMAAFLIIANDYSFFHYFDGKYASSETQLWHDDFGKNIGAPRGVATVNEYVYTRTFENAIVTVDLQTKTSSIVWGPTPGGDDTIHEIGLIQAEDHNDMSGVEPETTTDVGGGLNIVNIGTGDWMEYEVNVPSSGTYTLDYRLASLNGGGYVQLQAEGVTKETSIASTGGWQDWETLSTSVSLSSGVQTIRLYAAAGGWNFNWFKLTLENGDDHGNDAENATIINPNESNEGTIEVVGDFDFFTFIPLVNGDITIFTSGNSDMSGSLFDDNGNLITSDDSGEGDNFRFNNIEVIGNRSYYIGVSGLGESLGAYQLRTIFSSSPLSTQCNDGSDNDGDGLIDLNDPGCSTSEDDDEYNLITQCADGIDNDGDGLTDLNDPGCSGSTDNDEFNAPVTEPTVTPTSKSGGGGGSIGFGFTILWILVAYRRWR